jgi:hypothetical protein
MGDPCIAEFVSGERPSLPPGTAYIGAGDIVGIVVAAGMAGAVGIVGAVGMAGVVGIAGAVGVAGAEGNTCALGSGLGAPGFGGGDGIVCASATGCAVASVTVATPSAPKAMTAASRGIGSFCITRPFGCNASSGERSRAW